MYQYLWLGNVRAGTLIWQCFFHSSLGGSWSIVVLNDWSSLKREALNNIEAKKNVELAGRLLRAYLLIQWCFQPISTGCAAGSPTNTWGWLGPELVNEIADLTCRWTQPRSETICRRPLEIFTRLPDIRYFPMAKFFFRSRSEPREISSWTWEIVAMISNVASFIALTITLFIYDGKPVSHWNFPITLNTIVSILSTVSKTTLLFAVAEAMGQWKWILLSWEQRPVNEFERVDAASRGPWGSTKLLWPSPGMFVFLEIPR